MTSKQRSYLKGLAMTMDPIFQLGKSSLTPENTQAIAEALEARELIKINVLQNCINNLQEYFSKYEISKKRSGWWSELYKNKWEM